MLEFRRDIENSLSDLANIIPLPRNLADLGELLVKVDEPVCLMTYGVKTRGTVFVLISYAFHV
jgi:hypothetical protein